MTETRPRSSGRPRDPQVGAAIEASALRLIGELGFDAVSMERIATDAGVGKPTIYRRWATKGDLLVDAVRHRVEQMSDSADTGSLRGDLVALFATRTDELDRDDGLALRIVAALPGHPELLRTVRSVTDGSIRRQSIAVLTRALARGELAALPTDDFVFRAAERLFVGHAVLGELDAISVARTVDELLLPALHRVGGPAAGPVAPG